MVKHQRTNELLAQSDKLQTQYVLLKVRVTEYEKMRRYYIGTRNESRYERRALTNYRKLNELFEKQYAIADELKQIRISGVYENE